MKIPLIILVLLLLLPVAAATQVIPVTSSGNMEAKPFGFFNQDNYSFQLSNALGYSQYGNTTATNQTPVQMVESVALGLGRLSDSTTFTENVSYNGTEFVIFTIAYVKGCTLGICSWTETTNMSFNGGANGYCEATLGGNNPLIVNTQNIFNGILQSIGGIGLPTGDQIVTGDTIAPNPQIDMGTLPNFTIPSNAGNVTPDHIFYQLTDGVFGRDFSCNNPITGTNTIPIGQLTEGFNFQPSYFDNQLHTAYASYSVVGNSSWQARSFPTATDASLCGGLYISFFVNFCFDPAGIIGLMFNGVTAIITNILVRVIPGGKVISQIISVPFDMIVGLASLIQDLLFNNGSPYGVAGVLWMHEVYAFTLGCIATAYSGEWKYIVTFPWYLFMASVYVTIYVAYFVFYLVPKTALYLLGQAWIAITNPVP